MKKVFYILFLLINFGLYSQITRFSPYVSLKYGELDKAKEGIDKQINHLKTKTALRTWWVRGMIYQEIQKSSDFKYLCDTAELVALNSYIQSLVYNFKNMNFWSLDIENNPDDKSIFLSILHDDKVIFIDTVIKNDIINEKIVELSDTLVNIGINYYRQAKNYNKAVKYFEKSLFISEIINKLDTELMYYNVFACQKAKQYKLSNKYIDKLLMFGYGDDKVKSDLFIIKSRNYKALGDTVLCCKTLDKAIKKYPNQTNAKYEKINCLLEQEKNRKARKQIKNTNSSDSVKMYHMYYDMAALYDETGNIKKAEEYYLKSLEINTEYFNSNYNLAVLYYNQASDIYNSANDIPTEKSDKYFEQINAAKLLFKKSLPYFVKANQLDGDNVNTLNALKIISGILGIDIKTQ